MGDVGYQQVSGACKPPWLSSRVDGPRQVLTPALVLRLAVAPPPLHPHATSPENAVLARIPVASPKPRRYCLRFA
ncbi:hypothetical protein TRIUR3_28219 [Triticum urartu]|uniref:Uncharacterized protein n=1 Tax=Triticum urartu TaxID=4572 RepID=M8A053_TRIUA|nr:hypothetical protein TRIUR3_28219 [Triticum urartu]